MDITTTKQVKLLKSYHMLFTVTRNQSRRGFQIPGIGFQIFVSETWISYSKAGNLDFTSKNFQDSGIRIPLHEARDY